MLSFLQERERCDKGLFYRYRDGVLFYLETRFGKKRVSRIEISLSTSLRSSLITSSDTMAVALRAVNSLACAAPLRAAARRAARAPAARLGVRAMADESEDAPEGVEQLIDVRVGKVLKGYKHEDADKLYVEEVDIGEAEPRMICSGLVPYMNAEVRSGDATTATPRRWWCKRVSRTCTKSAIVIASVPNEIHFRMSRSQNALH